MGVKLLAYTYNTTNANFHYICKCNECKHSLHLQIEKLPMHFFFISHAYYRSNKSQNYHSKQQLLNRGLTLTLNVENASEDMSNVDIST